MRILFFLPVFLFAAHIFVLHRIDDSRYLKTNTSSVELRKYFEYLQENDYNVVTLSALIDMINQKQDTSKVVVFTIDDGYKSFYENGLPLFIEYGYPFTLFVYVRATNEKWGDFMNWDDIRDALKYGEVGVHSYSHPHLVKLSLDKVEKDTKKAIFLFKEKLDFVPKIYSYPYGEYNASIKKTILKYFPYIVNQNSGVNYDVSDLQRIALVGKVNFKKLLQIKPLKIENLKITREKNKIIQITGSSDKKYLFIYLTGFGWKKVIVKDSKFSLKPDFELKKYRNRLIIRYNNENFSKLILKEE
ncbi:MAG: polysaccharide deacetylase family protein [Epsilonproteobacteria bacterium]|nr:polysaccharide deacetylase family protein [Campylobacterota bacterium]